MIDLAPTIRKYLLTINGFTDIISNYKTSKAVFNYRPVPNDAEYPMSVIQTASGGNSLDYLNCNVVTVAYHIFIYDRNSTPQQYINIEKTANIVARSFHRMNVNLLDQNGFKVVSVTASNPFPAPTDDNETIARAITLNFEVKY